MCGTIVSVSQRQHPRPARAALFVAMALAVSLGAGGCAKVDREAVATAKCSLAVSQKAGFDQDLTPLQVVTVTNLGGGRYRVEGSASAGDKTVAYTCEVAPDASDKLRGLRVTRLDVAPN